MGRPPCHSFGATGPSMFSRSGFASFHDRGSPAIFGRDRASSGFTWRAPGREGQPGVRGSPGTMKSYVIAPRWMWLSGPQGPSGNTGPRFHPSSAGSL